MDTKPHDNKMPYPTYKPDQPERIIIKKKSKKGKGKGKKGKVSKDSDIVIHRYKDEYPHIAYIPYSIPQMSTPPQPSPQFPYQTPPQFRPFYDNRSFAQYYQYNMPQDIPSEQPREYDDIPMANMFQRQPAPYSLVNQSAMIQPLNPPMEDYQVEQPLQDIPIPRPNPILPEIQLDPVRVERLSGRQRRPSPIQDEPEVNPSERVFDVEVDIIPSSELLLPSPPPPVFEERRPATELLSQQDLENIYLEQQRKLAEIYKREDIARPPKLFSYDPTERTEKRRENLGRPIEPLKRDEIQLLLDYSEIKFGVHPRNRTEEQRALFERGEKFYKARRQNPEVKDIIRSAEDVIIKEGRSYRNKK